MALLLPGPGDYNVGPVRGLAVAAGRRLQRTVPAFVTRDELYEQGANPEDLTDPAADPEQPYRGVRWLRQRYRVGGQVPASLRPLDGGAVNPFYQTAYDKVIDAMLGPGAPDRAQALAQLGESWCMR
jgi:hypothetical protein